MIIKSKGILIFHDELAKNVRNRGLYHAHVDTAPLIYNSDILGSNQLPNFQIWREVTGNAITAFQLIECNTGAVTDLTSYIGAGLTLKEYEAKENFEVIEYAGAGMTAIPRGEFYIIISDGVESYYSNPISFE